MKQKEVTMDQALLDPADVFAKPDDVLAHTGLSHDQKVEILRRWEYDASEAAVALEEGMPGSESELLAQIVHALHQLTGGLDLDQVAPTKHHGIPRSATKPD